MSIQTTTTMFEEKTDSKWRQMTNGNGMFAEVQKEESTRFWTKICLNEWTFSLSLLALSFSIVLGKVYVNYGKLLLWQIDGQQSLPSVTMFTQIYNTIPSIAVLSKFDTKRLSADNSRFLNTSNYYAETTTDMLVTVYGKYGWLLKAMVSGLVITSFTWFILYKDSSVPGVNPPFPFSPSKQRIRDSSRIQMNYLVGALNGILIFIYMCL